MARQFLLAALAGIAGAFLYTVGAYGFLGGVLLCLAQVPLFAAGLGFGVAAAVIAGLTGAGAVLLAQGPLQALSFVLLCGLAPVLLCRLALRSRQREEQRQWYPAGRLLAWLTALAGANYLVAVALYAGEPGGLSGVIETMLGAVLENLSASPGAAPEYAAQLRQAVTAMAKWIPAAMAVWWMFSVILAAAAAQTLLVRNGHNRRPSPDFRRLNLPLALAPVLAGLLALSLIPGGAGPIAATLAAIVLTAYFVLGLAVVHAIARPWAAKGTALAVFYTTLILFGWPAVLVAGLGIVEQWSHIRARVAGPSHRQEDE